MNRKFRLPRDNVGELASNDQPKAATFRPVAPAPSSLMSHRCEDTQFTSDPDHSALVGYTILTRL